MWLRVDTDALAGLGSSLSGLADTLSVAGAQADGLSHAVGDCALAEQVVAFASSWDGRRADLVGRLRSLGEASSQVAARFDEADGSLAASVREA